jgi:hypothetical protein
MGKSIMRNLTVIVALTWIPFPIWYALSPEGFNVISNSAAMKISVAFLNVFSKGAFIFYINRVRSELDVRERALIQAKMTMGGDDVEEGKAEDPTHTLNKHTAATIYEVMQSMGRANDFEVVKGVLEKHMITSSEDFMVLTPDYCESINLPFGFVQAVKQKIRAHKIEMQDAWTTKKMQPLDLRSNKFVGNVSRPPSEAGGASRIGDEPTSPTGRDAPLPPQVASDPRKLREHARRQLSQLGRDPSEFDDLMGVTPRAELERAELQAMLQQSQMALSNEIRELRLESAQRAKHAAEMEQKVEADLENAQEVVGEMMGKVMDVLERRLQHYSARNETRQSILGMADEP